jgi:AraC-like DNA-binding protein
VDSKETVSPWPEKLLRQQQVKRMYVCGHTVEPPLLSHVVNFPRLEIPLSGCYENKIATDRQIATVSLRPGDALFAPPNCWNLPTWRHPFRLLSVLFGKKQLGLSIVTLSHPSKPRLVAEKFSQPRQITGPVPKILDALLELHAAGLPEAPFAELAQALLQCLSRSYQPIENPEVSPAKSLLEEVCVYLQNHYPYELTRESVARQFGISPNHLSRIFQMQGHMTFTNYLMHVRTDRAKFLLRNYNLKLDDIAARCGYHDPTYFCRVFKKLAKVTPAEYRAAQKQTVTTGSEPRPFPAPPLPENAV